MLTRAGFEIMFGGYTFSTDRANERMTRSAWKAFTQNLAFTCPHVEGESIKHKVLYFLNLPSMLKLFEGAELDLAKIKVKLDGIYLSKERFRTTFGGYVFSLDYANEFSTRDAWIAFTRNEMFHPRLLAIS